MARLYRSGLIISAAPGRPGKPTPTGKGLKVFRVDQVARRKIFDAVHIQATTLSNCVRPLSTKDNLVFLTPTFSPESNWQNANEILSRWLENLKKTYGVTSYVWCRELTEHLLPHYHVLATMPFTPIQKLNRTWSIARGDLSVEKNALRTGWDAKKKRSVMIVKDYVRAMRYAAKYTTKATSGDVCSLKTFCTLHSAHQSGEPGNTGHTSKAYGITRNLLCEPQDFDFSLLRHLATFVDYRKLTGENLYADVYAIDEPLQSEYVWKKVQEINAELIEIEEKKAKNAIPLKKCQKFSDQYQLFS